MVGQIDICGGRHQFLVHRVEAGAKHGQQPRGVDVAQRLLCCPQRTIRKREFGVHRLNKVKVELAVLAPDLIDVGLQHSAFCSARQCGSLSCRSFECATMLCCNRDPPGWPGQRATQPVVRLFEVNLCGIEQLECLGLVTLFHCGDTVFGLVDTTLNLPPSRQCSCRSECRCSGCEGHDRNEATAGVLLLALRQIAESGDHDGCNRYRCQN